MKVSFEGIPSGDYECFCWAVDRETYIKITGKEPDEQFDTNRFNKHPDGNPLYNLYITDIIGHEDKKQRFTIEVDEE